MNAGGLYILLCESDSETGLKDGLRCAKVCVNWWMDSFFGPRMKSRMGFIIPDSFSK